MDRLENISLTEQAAEAIKRQILTRHLQVGERLPSERQLCEALGVSRGILREALGILVGQGIVTKTPGRGIFVGDFDRHALDVHIRLTITDEAGLGALRDLRNMLEIGVLELIVQRSTPEELDQLEEMIGEMERGLSQGERINELDAGFHFALFATAHVPALLGLYEQILRDVTDMTIFQNPQVRDALTPDISASNLSLLREVLDALRQRNVCEAQQAMKEHISMVRNGE